MSQPLRLSLIINADAKGVAPATAEARREIASLGIEAGKAGKAIAVANDAAAAASRRATEAAIGQARAERDLREAVNRFAGVRQPLDAAAFERRAADVAAFGTELDRLRARFNPLYAEIQRYRTAQSEIRDAHRIGAISVDEMSAALSRE